MIPTEKEFYQALSQRHGAQLQKKLSAARVAVCGLGGLGSNIAIALARAGVGHLHLIDFDRVDITNLNRQQYFVRQLGLLKTDALQETLTDIAPYCRVITDPVRITEDNLAQLLENEDIICEAFDRSEAKAMLVNGVLEQFPENICCPPPAWRASARPTASAPATYFSAFISAATASAMSATASAWWLPGSWPAPPTRPTW